MDGLFMGLQREAASCPECGKAFDARHGAAICHFPEFTWGDVSDPAPVQEGVSLVAVQAEVKRLKALIADIHAIANRAFEGPGAVGFVGAVGSIYKITEKELKP